MTKPQTADWITGMRGLIAWLEQHPEIDLECPRASGVRLRACPNASVAQAREFAARCDLNPDGEYPGWGGVVREVAFSRGFGPITVEVWGQDFDDVPARPRRRTLGDRIKAVIS